jgi:uncharacterized protein
MIIALDPRFQYKQLEHGENIVYLDKFSGEWFVAKIEAAPLLQRLALGISQEHLSELTHGEVRLIERLAQEGFLSGSRKPASVSNAGSSRDKVTLVIIESSSYCNLACSYCFEDVPTKGKKMSFDTADAIVESIKKLHLADTFVVEFNGGESFMNLPVMERIVDQVNASDLPKKHNVSYGVTTNLTVLKQEVIDFLKKHSFSVSVSLDGVQEDHDRHRFFASGVGSHKYVLSNMEVLKNNGVEFSTISVISVPGQLTRAYNFLKRQRIPYVSFAIRRHSERLALDKVDYEEIAEELVDVFADSLEAFKAQQFAPKVMDASVLIKNLISPIDPEYMCLRTPCGAGTNMITYDTSGDIYACQDLIKEPVFKICHASDDNPRKRIDDNSVVQRLRERKPGGNRGCEDCDFQMFCQGGCYSTSYYAAKKELDESFSTKTPHCEYYYASFTRLLSLVAKEGEMLPKYLQSTPYLFS